MKLLGLIIWGLQSHVRWLAERHAMESRCVSKALIASSMFPFCLCEATAAVYPVPVSQCLWLRDQLMAGSISDSPTWILPADLYLGLRDAAPPHPTGKGTQSHRDSCARTPSPTPPRPCFPVLFQSHQVLLLLGLSHPILQYLSETISSEVFPHLFSEEKLMVDIQTSLRMLHFLQRWKTESGSLRDRQCISDFEDTLHSVVRDGSCQWRWQRNQTLEEWTQRGGGVCASPKTCPLHSCPSAGHRATACDSSLPEGPPEPCHSTPPHPSAHLVQWMDGQGSVVSPPTALSLQHEIT